MSDEFAATAADAEQVRLMKLALNDLLNQIKRRHNPTKFVAVSALSVILRTLIDLYPANTRREVLETNRDPVPAARRR